ncbi:hypothetical protein OnM2_098023 [Erysiphe neolycopersici]|uniref:Uncharacterized protein n=1 Tax=Erysiphe neolycopersici TaxID=212602 RepID=A0A420HAA2_9PEZI|nr:hypothetical protein OnM2_098023 [Erysiphe neolycopersici]
MLPNDNSIMSWLDEWELVYSEAKELNLPHVLDPQAQYDFLYSVENITGAWTELKLAMIDDQARSVILRGYSQSAEVSNTPLTKKGTPKEQKTVFVNTTIPITVKYKKEIFDKINGKLKAAYMGKVRLYIANKLEYDPKTTPSAVLKSNN